MNANDLSHFYCLATLNAHKVLDELYEELHTRKGEPKTNPVDIKSIKQSYIFKIRQELDLIQASVEEHFEEL